MRAYILIICLSAFLVAGNAHAHHPGHGAAASAGSRSILYNGNRTTPSSRLFLSYDLAYLDNSLGQLHTWMLSGEWAVHRRFSLLGIVPILYLDHNFRANATGIGDIAVGSKVLVLDNERVFIFLSTAFSFPTGDESNGLGRGSVGQQIDAFAGLRLGNWTLFLSPGVNFAYESPHEPMIIIAVGVNTPRVAEKIYFDLTANTQVFVTSDVFDNGSWKLYLNPQINWIVDKGERLTLNLTGRFSVVDKLSRKAGVTLTNTNNALLNDVLWGLTVGCNYSF